MRNTEIVGIIKRARNHRWPRSGVYRLFPIVSVFFPMVWLWLWLEDSTIFREHGPMENAQVVLVAMGLVAVLWRMSGAGSTVERWMLAAMGLLYLTFVLLECDTRGLDWELLRRLTNGVWRNLWLGGLWIFCSWKLFAQRVEVFSTGTQWLRGKPGFFLIASGCFWVEGWIFDKSHLFQIGGSGLMLEEMMEGNASLFMFIAAIQIWVSPRDQLPKEMREKSEATVLR